VKQPNESDAEVDYSLDDRAVVVSERERQIVLFGLHELMIERNMIDDGSHAIRLLRLGVSEIKALAARFDGDPAATWFGATILKP
jgi:hypothetical protein